MTTVDPNLPQTMYLLLTNGEVLPVKQLGRHPVFPDSFIAIGDTEIRAFVRQDKLFHSEEAAESFRDKLGDDFVNFPFQVGDWVRLKEKRSRNPRRKVTEIDPYGQVIRLDGCWNDSKYFELVLRPKNTKRHDHH